MEEYIMGRYEKIVNELQASADRKRIMKQIEAKAEMDAVNREFVAYVDGVNDAVNAIRAEEESQEFRGV